MYYTVRAGVQWWLLSYMEQRTDELVYLMQHAGVANSDGKGVPENGGNINDLGEHWRSSSLAILGIGPPLSRKLLAIQSIIP
jgi:hypothetical protein